MRTPPPLESPAAGTTIITASIIEGITHMFSLSSASVVTARRPDESVKQQHEVE